MGRFSSEALIVMHRAFTPVKKGQYLPEGPFSQTLSIQLKRLDVEGYSDPRRSVISSILPCEGSGAGANPVDRIFDAVAEKDRQLAATQPMQVQVLSASRIFRIIRPTAKISDFQSEDPGAAPG